MHKKARKCSKLQDNIQECRSHKPALLKEKKVRPNADDLILGLNGGRFPNETLFCKALKAVKMC